MDKNKETDVEHIQSHTAARAARIAAAHTLETAAAAVRVTPAYLGRIERHGRAPYVLANRLCSLYQCRITVFLYTELGGRTPNTAPRRSHNRRGA